MSFAKYDIEGDLREVRSSARAVRGYCDVCRDPIYMVYDGSDNAWIATEVFTFDYSMVETYDIFRD
jgi:hypothetical protein